MRGEVDEDRAAAERSWLVRISYQEAGKTKELSKTFARRREAERWKSVQEADRERGVLRRPCRDTVGEHLTKWLRDLTGVGGRTREDYKNIVRRYIGRTAEECRVITERYGVEPALGLRRLSGRDAVGLRWADLDLPNREVSIVRKLRAARHTCATLLFEAGHEMKDVQEILGLSSIVVRPTFTAT